MKKLLAMSLVLLFIGANAQNCDSYEIKLNQQVQRKTFTEAYSTLKEALAKCPDKKINFYNFGETVLQELIDESTDEAKKKVYAQDLVNLIQMRMKNFPDDKKTFWEGEIINYETENELITKKEAYEKYNVLFEGIEDRDDVMKVSANTVLTYYATALELMQEQEIDFEKALAVYFKTKKAAESNIELRSLEFGKLAEKLDSLQQINPKLKLSEIEQQKMKNAQAAKDNFLDVNESMEAILAQYTTCDNLAPMYINNFEANKDSLEWLKTSYAQLASLDCYDQPVMTSLKEQYEYVWKKQNPQKELASAPSKGSAIGSHYGAGARDFKKGKYSSAIASFKKALAETSGSKKGEIGYYIALSYQKTGSLSNAVSWAKKAASYKPGYGAPYQLIAGVFGSNANSCGSNTFQKLSAYWVAADFANKACAVDSRSCKWSRSAARSYNANGPSMEMAFQQGKKKGDRVSVSCFGGASTRVR